MAGGWRRWFVRDGRLRALWRGLLFVALFLTLLQLGLLLVPGLGTADGGDRLSPALIAQAALMLAAAVLAGWAMLGWVDGRPIGELGFDTRPVVPRELALGLVIGAAGLVAVVLMLTLSGAYRYGPDDGSVVGWLMVSGISLAAFALPAAAEEALFRGYLFRTLVEGAGAVAAVAVTSLLFALVHGSNPNVSTLGLVNIFLAGVLLAVAVLRTGALWLATAVHLGWNWVMAGPLDLPVSGLAAYDVPLYDVTGAGPVWVTGGAFGPEGGLAGTGAAALTLALVLWTTRPGGSLAGALESRRHDGVQDR